ncbi:MAG: hypothetical protein CMM29_10085 [Rhodospirillaceae bacterium]|nr:hypothetical protein [Rhodospirillaceae bacterium]
MAVTETSYTGNGSTTNYSFTFPYLKSTDIEVQLNASVTTNWSLANATTIQFTAPSGGATSTQESGGAPKSAVKIKILRKTNIDSLAATFYPGSAIKSEDLNDNSTQNIYVSQEINDRYFANTGGTMTGDLTIGEDASIIFEGATDNDYETTLAVTDPTADRTITIPDISGTILIEGKANSITSGMIVDGAVATADIAADAIDGTRIADDAVNSEHLAADSIDAEHYAPGSVDATALASGSVIAAKIGADAVDGTKIADDSINSEHYVAASIDNEHLADDAVGADELAADAVVNASVAAGAAIEFTKLENLDSSKILVGNGSNKATEVALSGDITINNAGVSAIGANTVEIGMLDCEQTTISDSDSHVPTSGAVVDYVAAQISPLGGFSVIADDESFPNTQAAAGVVISISDAAGISINSSGVSTNADTLDNTTVTINGFPSELRGGVGGNADPYVLGAGTGLMVKSTGSGQIYDYHQVMIKESDFVQLSDDINDFNSRYRIGTRTANNHSSNDDGDLFFDTGTNKMYVYDGAYDSGGSWGEVTSVGEFKVLGIKDNGQAHDGSGPTFNGSNDQYDLFEGTSDASISQAAQLLVVLNGVLQKPNDGGWSGSNEGFHLDGADGIRFCDPPPSGSTLYVTKCGSAVAVNVPADGTVTEAKMNISNDGTNGQFLSKQSGNTGGMTWADVPAGVGGANGVTFNDGVYANWGNSSDLKIAYDGSSNIGQIYISDVPLQILTGTGRELQFWHDDSGSDNAQFAHIKDTDIWCKGHFVTGNQGELRLNDADSSKYVGFKSPATVANNKIWTLPAADGSSGQALTTDGSAALSWSNVESTVANGAIYINDDEITDDYTVAAGKGAHSVGPITLTGCTVTVNGRWVIS